MRIFLTTSALIFMVACNAVNFSGKSGKGGGSSSSSNSGGNQNPEGSNPDGAGDVGPCEKIQLPTSPVSLTEVMHWVANGPTAEYDQVMASPVVGPLSPGDAVPSILAPAFKGLDYRDGGAYMYAIDGKSGAQKWVSPMKTIASASAALGNIDGEGDNDVVVIGLDYKLHALNSDGTLKWSSTVDAIDASLAFDRLPGPVVADLDNDGVVEIISPKGVFNGKDGAFRFALPGDHGFFVIVDDVDSDGHLEIITKSGIVSAGGQAICNFPYPLWMQAAAKLTKTDSHSTIVGFGDDTAYGFSGKDCSTQFSLPFPGGGGGPVNIADYNNDGVLEFGSAGASYFVVFNSKGEVLWKRETKDKSSARTGATTFDFNGDGAVEVVYNDEDHLRVFDGRTGNVIYQQENSSGTLVEYPVMVDANGNGRADLVVGSNDAFDYTNKSSKGVKVFRGVLDNWMPTRKIWNQHAFNPLLVGDKGELTGFDAGKIYKPWLSSKHLVGFRNNIPQDPKLTDPCNK